MDDFNWFLPADEQAGDLPALVSEMGVSDRESEVEYIEPDSTPLQMKTMAKQLLCPPVVAQTRPMEGCNPASPRQLRRGRDVLTEDGAVALDTRQVGCGAPGRLRGCSAETSRFRLHGAWTYSRRWMSV